LPSVTVAFLFTDLVGMHTGPAVHRAGDWYGTTVNLASRLCTAASGGEVLVSASTALAAAPLREVRLGEPACIGCATWSSR